MNHREIWAATHGCPVPEGHIIHHVDGNGRNNRADNLICITPREHLRLHREARIATGKPAYVGKKLKHIPMPDDPKAYVNCYSLSAAAKALNRPKATLVLWMDNGQLEELPVRGHVRLITAESLRAKARELGVTLADGGKAA